MDEVIIEIQGLIEDLNDKVADLENYIDRVKIVFDDDSVVDDMKLLEKKEEPKKPRTIQEIKALKPKWVEETIQERIKENEKYRAEKRLELDELIEKAIRRNDSREKFVDICIGQYNKYEFIQQLKKEGFEIDPKEPSNWIGVIIP